MDHYWTANGTDIEREIRDLSGIVSDYPGGDPFLSISVLAGDAAEAAREAAEHSPVLPVLGLVATVPYLCWRSRDAALNDRVYASLKSVTEALDPLPCPHGDAKHPGDSSPEPDALVYAMEELSGIYDEPDDEEEAELWACPRNLAALARDASATMAWMLADDGPVAQAGEGVFAPELRDVPDLFFDHVSAHHTMLATARTEPGRPIRAKWLVKLLIKVVRRQHPGDDRPEDDQRGLLLWTARELRSRPDGTTGAGLLLALSSAYTYAMGDEVPERVVRDELIEAFSEAHRVRRDATCEHAGEHPALDPEETLVAAAKLWDPEYDDDAVEAKPVSAGTVAAVACPAHVREVALRSAADLRRDVAERFGPSAGVDLDTRFLDADGALRADRVARDVRFHNAGPDLETSPAVWCARRLLDGVADPRERAALVLSVAHAVRHPHWYADVPGAFDELTAALGAVAAADPGECEHTDGHTAVPLETYTPPQIAQLIPLVHDSFSGELTWRHPEERPFLRPNRYMDEEGPGPDRWRCPGHLAALARLALAEADAG